MAKGRIRTTMQKDYFGNGNEREITFDNGKTYRIRSTMQKDYFGGGQEVEIYESGQNNTSSNGGYLSCFTFTGVWALVYGVFLRLWILFLYIFPVCCIFIEPLWDYIPIAMIGCWVVGLFITALIAEGPILYLAKKAGCVRDACTGEIVDEEH